MTEPISLLVFPFLLVIYILGIVIFYSKQLYGLTKYWNSDKSSYIRKMLYGIPVFAVIAIALVALLFIGCLVELGGIDGINEYFTH